MSSGSSNNLNLNGDVEPNKTKHEGNNEESSHLLEASENGAKYGSRQAVKIVKANASESANASPQVKPNTETIYQSLLTGAGTKPIYIFKFLSPNCANLSTTVQCLTLTEQIRRRSRSRRNLSYRGAPN